MKPKHSTMAMAASVGNAYVRSGLANGDWFYRKKAVHFRDVVKLWPRSKKSRYLHLNTSGRNFCGLGSKWSTLLFSRTEEISSSFSMSCTNKDEVVPKTYWVILGYEKK